MNAPEKKPYRTENTMSFPNVLANIQETRIKRPEMKDAGARRLNLPMVSERMAGATRPRTPPVFMRDSTTNAIREEIPRLCA